MAGHQKQMSKSIWSNTFSLSRIICSRWFSARNQVAGGVEMPTINSYVCGDCDFSWREKMSSCKKSNCPKCGVAISPHESEEFKHKHVFSDLDCCSGHSSYIEEINGFCHDCGCLTVDGKAITGCSYSPVICETCGASPCDQSC